jgi:hypothetical protein
MKSERRQVAKKGRKQQKEESESNEDINEEDKAKKERDYFKYICRSIGCHKEITKTTERAKKTRREKPTFVKNFYTDNPAK